MYELNKQKSTGYRIILGIIIFAFISFVLKMALNKPSTSLNDDLITAANNINAHAPIVIDSLLRFDRVNALQGNTLQYNYTLTTLDKSQVDTNVLKTTGRQLLIDQMKQNPQSSIFRKNGIVIEAKYADKEGAYVALISITPNEY